MNEFIVLSVAKKQGKKWIYDYDIAIDKFKIAKIIDYGEKCLSDEDGVPLNLVHLFFYENANTLTELPIIIEENFKKFAKKLSE